MIKDLFAVVDGSEKCRGFLEAAVALAEAGGAHLEVGVLTALPLAVPELAPFFELYLPDSALARDASQRAAEVRLALARARCPVSVIEFHDDMLWLAGDFRRSHQLADLLLVGPQSAWEIPWLRQRMIESMILSSGTPLVLLPEAGGLGRIRRAVIGWKPSREAVRAVHDIVALAEPGAQIDVVAIGYAPRADDGDPTRGAEVKRHLERHGFRVELHWLYDADADEAELLQRFTADAGADLLAIGGFAHSRVREILLGGVTRALVHRNRVPVLLSH